MANGGQTYRWEQLMRHIGAVCNWALWLSPVMLAGEAIFGNLTAGDSQRLIWKLAVVVIWALGLLIYQIFFKKNRLADGIFITLFIALVAVYINLIGEINGFVAVVLFAIVINSLLKANLLILVANILGFELLVIAGSRLLVGQGVYGESLRNLAIIFGIGYGLVLMILSLYNSDKPTAVSQKTTAPADNSLATLINNLNSGIIRVNHDLNVNLYNAASLAILDTNLTLTGRKITEVLQIFDLSEQPIDLEKLIHKTNRTQIFDEILYFYKNGDKIRLEMTISPVKNVYGVTEDDEWIMILRDVTLAKNLETERDEFISVVSHELRTPIAITEASLSNLEILLERQADRLLINNTLNKAHQQVLFLSAMMNDLSSLARADRSEVLQLEELDLTKVLQSLFEKYQQQVNDKGLKFDLDIDPQLTTIKTHPLYLEEILQNLLTNAIKYTKAGTITLSAKKLARQIEISVADTGVGIAKNQREKVFDKFYRVEDYKTRETGGTGLGLYVSRRLTEKLGGELRLKSRIGFGSTFSLVLPIKVANKRK